MRVYYNTPDDKKIIDNKSLWELTDENPRSRSNNFG